MTPAEIVIAGFVFVANILLIVAAFTRGQNHDDIMLRLKRIESQVVRPPAGGSGGSDAAPQLPLPRTAPSWTCPMCDHVNEARLISGARTACRSCGTTVEIWV